jgi:hypothetical protein
MKFSPRLLPEIVFLLFACFFGLTTEPQAHGLHVTLVSFEAETNVDQIDLFWETAIEFDIYGFYIQRSLQESGPYTDISPLIPGEGGELLGYYYFYSDTDVQLGVTYYYKLRVVNIDGTNEFYGPVWGKPGSPPTNTLAPASTSTTARTPTGTPTATSTPTPTASNNASTATPTLTRTPTATSTFTSTYIATSRPAFVLYCPIVCRP